LFFGDYSTGALSIGRVFFLTLRVKEVRRLAKVVLRPNESQDQLLRRFRKKVIKGGVLSTIRKKRWFASKSETRRAEKKKAVRRMKRHQMTH
jgi:small subunit ribosomal protein S21